MMWGKYISIEKRIEKTKDRYYEALEVADSGWHEVQNNSNPLICYMLQVLLVCSTEFEDRLGTIDNRGRGKTAYNVVKNYALEKVGKFTSADVIAHCPSVGRSSALTALKRLAEEGTILQYEFRCSTFYVKAEEQQI